MSSTQSFFPTMPKTGISFPTTPLLQSALEYCKKHVNPATINHCLRSASFAILISKRHPSFAGVTLDMELVVYSALMHDLGWATTKELLSTDKRFEVDGANLARQFVLDSPEASGWDKHRLQLSWDAIALHTTRSIALYKEPEVVAVSWGIMADFWSRDVAVKDFVTDEEHKEIVDAFPRLGFKEELIKIMCGLCRDKPNTTMDNLVASFGCQYGYDGKGTGKEEFAQKFAIQGNIANAMLGGLDQCAALE